MHKNSSMLENVTLIYSWLEAQIYSHTNLAGQCNTCGKCCDFDKFDHRLFVTPPELEYLTAKLGQENIKPMTTGRCPYNVSGKCTVYEYRFAGCRIFCCKADTDFQNQLSEEAIEKFKSLCVGFQIPYRYTDLATALNSQFELFSRP